MRQALKEGSRIERNEAVLYAHAAMEAYFLGAAMTFAPVLLVRLGAPALVVGAYTSLPALIMALAMFPAGAVVQRSRSVSLAQRWSVVSSRGIVGLLAVVPLLSPTLGIYALVLARALVAVPTSVASVAFPTILGKAVPPSSRSRVLSTRLGISRLMMALYGLLAGWWLAAIPYPLNYQLLFAGVLVSGIGTVLISARLDLPESIRERLEGYRKLDVRVMWRVVRSQPVFVRFLVAALVFRFGMALPLPLIAIYRVRTVQATDAWIGTLLTVQRLLQMAAFFALGRLLHRGTLRSVLWVTCFGMALYPLATALATRPVLLLIPETIHGLFGAGMEVFLTTSLLAASPKQHRPVLVATDVLAYQGMRAVAPVLGTAMTELAGIRAALVVATAASLVGAALLRRYNTGTEALE